MGTQGVPKVCCQLLFPTPSPAQVVTRTALLGPPWASCRPWRPCVPKLALAIGYFMNTLGTHLGNTGCSQGVFSTCVPEPFPRPSSHAHGGVGPALGLLQAVAALCSQTGFGYWLFYEHLGNTPWEHRVFPRCVLSLCSRPRPPPKSSRARGWWPRLGPPAGLGGLVFPNWLWLLAIL